MFRQRLALFAPSPLPSSQIVNTHLTLDQRVKDVIGWCQGTYREKILITQTDIDALFSAIQKGFFEIQNLFRYSIDLHTKKSREERNWNLLIEQHSAQKQFLFDGLVKRIIENDSDENSLSPAEKIEFLINKIISGQNSEAVGYYLFLREFLRKESGLVVNFLRFKYTSGQTLLNKLLSEIDALSLTLNYIFYDLTKDENTRTNDFDGICLFHPLEDLMSNPVALGFLRIQSLNYKHVVFKWRVLQYLRNSKKNISLDHFIKQLKECFPAYFFEDAKTQSILSEIFNSASHFEFENINIRELVGLGKVLCESKSSEVETVNIFNLLLQEDNFDLEKIRSSLGNETGSATQKLQYWIFALLSLGKIDLLIKIYSDRKLFGIIKKSESSLRSLLINCGKNKIPLKNIWFCLTKEYTSQKTRSTREEFLEDLLNLGYYDAIKTIAPLEATHNENDGGKFLYSLLIHFKKTSLPEVMEIVEIYLTKILGFNSIQSSKSEQNPTKKFFNLLSSIKSWSREYPKIFDILNKIFLSKLRLIQNYKDNIIVQFIFIQMYLMGLYGQQSELKDFAWDYLKKIYNLDEIISLFFPSGYTRENNDRYRLFVSPKEDVSVLLDDIFNLASETKDKEFVLKLHYYLRQAFSHKGNNDGFHKNLVRFFSENHTLVHDDRYKPLFFKACENENFLPNLFLMHPKGVIDWENIPTSDNENRTLLELTANSPFQIGLIFKKIKETPHCKIGQDAFFKDLVEKNNRNLLKILIPDLTLEALFGLMHFAADINASLFKALWNDFNEASHQFINKNDYASIMRDFYEILKFVTLLKPQLFELINNATMSEKRIQVFDKNKADTPQDVIQYFHNMTKARNLNPKEIEFAFLFVTHKITTDYILYALNQLLNIQKTSLNLTDPNLIFTVATIAVYSNQDTVVLKRLWEMCISIIDESETTFKLLAVLLEVISEKKPDFLFSHIHTVDDSTLGKIWLALLSRSNENMIKELIIRKLIPKNMAILSPVNGFSFSLFLVFFPGLLPFLKSIEEKHIWLTDCINMIEPIYVEVSKKNHGSFEDLISDPDMSENTLERIFLNIIKDSKISPLNWSLILEKLVLKKHLELIKKILTQHSNIVMAFYKVDKLSERSPLIGIFKGLSDMRTHVSYCNRVILLLKPYSEYTIAKYNASQDGSTVGHFTVAELGITTEFAVQWIDDSTAQWLNTPNAIGIPRILYILVNFVADRRPILKKIKSLLPTLPSDGEDSFADLRRILAIDWAKLSAFPSDVKANYNFSGFFLAPHLLTFIPYILNPLYFDEILKLLLPEHLVDPINKVNPLHCMARQHFFSERIADLFYSKNNNWLLSLDKDNKLPIHYAISSFNNSFIFWAEQKNEFYNNLKKQLHKPHVPDILIEACKWNNLFALKKLMKIFPPEPDKAPLLFNYAFKNAEMMNILLYRFYSMNASSVLSKVLFDIIHTTVKDLNFLEMYIASIKVLIKREPKLLDILDANGNAPIYYAHNYRAFCPPEFQPAFDELINVLTNQNADMHLARNSQNTHNAATENTATLSIKALQQIYTSTIPENFDKQIIDRIINRVSYEAWDANDESIKSIKNFAERALLVIKSEHDKDGGSANSATNYRVLWWVFQAMQDRKYFTSDVLWAQDGIQDSHRRGIFEVLLSLYGTFKPKEKKLILYTTSLRCPPGVRNLFIEVIADQHRLVRIVSSDNPIVIEEQKYILYELSKVNYIKLITDTLQHESDILSPAERDLLKESFSSQDSVSSEKRLLGENWIKSIRQKIIESDVLGLIGSPGFENDLNAYLDPQVLLTLLENPKRPREDSENDSALAGPAPKSPRLDHANSPGL